MINVDNSTKAAWKNNLPKSYRVVLDGDEISGDKIYREDSEIVESVCDDNSLHYIGCIPSRLNIKLRGIDEDIIGQKIEIFASAGDTTELQLFSGNVTSANKDATKTKVNLIAYDKLYEINNMNVSEWYRTREFPMSLKQFRDGFFSFLNIEQEDVTLCNDSLIVRETIGGDAIKGFDILSAICEINGVFGAMSRDGSTFLYKSLANDVEDTIEASNIISLVHEDFSCKPINRLIIRADSDDIGAIAGTGTNTYIVEGNILAFGQTANALSDIANNLLGQIYGGQYVPSSVEAVGNAIYESGDCILYETSSGDYVKSYILSRKLKGIFAMYDEYEGKGCENYGNALQNSHDELIQLRGQANRLKRTVEGVTSEVETIRDDYASKSQLQQTSDSITAQIEYLQQEIDGESAIYYTQEAPTLLNYPAWDFTYNIPCNGTIRLRDDLRFEYTEEYYQRNLRALVYDESNNTAYRFVKENGVFGWREVADTELGAILQRLSSLELTTEGITAQVSEIETSYATKTELNSTVQQTASSITSTVSANYQTKSDAETTRSSLQSQITQTASSITSEVTRAKTAEGTLGSRITQTESSITSEITRAKAAEGTLSSRITQTESSISTKVSKGAVVSEINQSAEQITLNSNRLVVNSTNFKLDAQGKVQIAGDLRSGTSNNWFTRLNSAGISMYKDNSEIGYISSNVAGGMNFSAKSNIDFIINDVVRLRIASNPSSTVKHRFYGAVDFDEIYPTYITMSKNLSVGGNAIVSGDFYVSGGKYRSVNTNNFGTRLQNAYETCEPYFGDIGEAKIGSDGTCIIPIEEIFSETVSLDYGYQVFLQTYGEGSCYVAERNLDNFVVKGTPEMSFAWELKARQKGYENTRLELMKENE